VGLVAERGGGEGLTGLQKRVLLGRRIEAGARCIWPVIKALVWMRGGRAFIAHLQPFALLIVEGAEEYAITLSGRPLTVEELLEKAPELREALDEAHRARRIEIE